MSDVVKFIRPEDELPSWLASYDPDAHEAEVTLKDLQFLAQRVCAEHTLASCWASTAGGEPHLMICGRGMKCKHKVAVGKSDSFLAIMARVDQVVNKHIDQCLGRAAGHPTQLSLFA